VNLAPLAFSLIRKIKVKKAQDWSPLARRRPPLQNFPIDELELNDIDSASPVFSRAFLEQHHQF
jgi:hypothetical protein